MVGVPERQGLGWKKGNGGKRGRLTPDVESNRSIHVHIPSVLLPALNNNGRGQGWHLHLFFNMSISMIHMAAHLSVYLCVYLYIYVSVKSVL